MTPWPDVGQLRQHLGSDVAVSEWFEISQSRINQFADATDDWQWIHVDPDRAATESPYTATIAHGFLTLSLVSVLARRTLRFERVHMTVNCGVNRVRFLAPVPAGSRVRAHFSPTSLDDLDGSIQVVWRVRVERQGVARPCCVAEWLVRYYEGRRER